MKIDLTSVSTGQNHGPISMRCPHCRKEGTFESLGHVTDAFSNKDKNYLGIRKCPNPKCGAGVAVIVARDSGELKISYPAELLDFDASDIPDGIASTFEEALSCHAHGLHTAAAIMVRRTLEEICADKSASGKNLKQRIEALSKIIVIPNELVDAMDHLRLLGNDAAHVEAKTFADVGGKELDIAIDLTREILKSVYQFTGLLNKLKGLQK